MNAQVLGISVDSVPCLVSWAASLGGINYPLLSDFWPHGETAKQYGVLLPDGRSERALFIIDKEGIIQYVDVHDIDQQPDNETLRDELRRIDPKAAASEPAKPKAIQLPSGGIVMYCARWCPDCKRARNWMEKNGLEFTEVDVYSVPGAAEKVREWADGNLTTPTFDINGTIIVDWDEGRMALALGI